MKILANKKIMGWVVLFLMSFFLVACQGDEEPTKVMYTVIFDVNTEDMVQNQPDVVRVEQGKTVLKPSVDPVRTGYVFEGWYDNAEGTGSAYDFSKAVDRNNFVLYAVWSVQINYFNITFDYQGSRENVVSQVAQGGQVQRPNDPERSGYRFDGWFIDEAFSTQFNFQTAINNHLTIYVKWVEVVTITFEFNDDETAPLILTLDLLEELEAPEVSDRDGYSFGGWYLDQAFQHAYEFGEVEQSKTLYARWIETSETASYTVVFNYNYEGSPEQVTRTVFDGSVVSQPSTTRSNYRFLGWYTDQGTYQNRFLISTPVTKDLELYAHWVRTYQLSTDLNYEGAINPNPRTVDEQASITPPANPSRIGYTFAGWSDQKTGLIGFDFSAGISESTTVYAQWTKNYVFEAEHLDFNDFFGWGFSGNATGTDAIVYDATGVSESSNQRFVSYLYGKGITLAYEIYSDRAVDNVKLTLRLSGELKDFYIQSMKTPLSIEEEPVYTVRFNGDVVDYGEIFFGNVPSQSSNTIKPFEDFVVSVNLSLKEGKNEILLITDNELGMGGTMTATAPMVDCIKIETYAVLTWQPKLDNY